VGSLLIAGLTSCKKAEVAPLQIPTDQATLRDITVTADATGKIEPINIVDIKSKAGGQIIEMPVETGTKVMPGDLIVRLDPKDVEASYKQAEATLATAVFTLANSKKTQEQNVELLKSGVITQRDMDASNLDVQRQQSSLISAEQALELAKQRVADAEIRAPSEGTILDKLVSTGTVIASASGSASGGTTLVRMANLGRVRARVLVSETDIGKVQQGMTTSVLVDAFPNSPFTGVVEKMEPQAIVDQNVTMFPVLVNLANEEGALMPGMNGEVSILIERKNQVLSIPLDAFRLANEAGTVAEMFGLTKEVVDSVARAGTSRQRTTPAPTLDDSAAQVPVGRGSPAGNPPNGGGQGGQGGGRGQGPAVTDAECTAVTVSIGKVNGLKGQLDALTAKLADPNADRAAIGSERRTLLDKAGVDMQTYSSCQRRAMSNSGGTAGNAGGGAGGGRAFGGGRGGRGTRGGGGGGRGGAGSFGALGQRNNGLGVRNQGLAQQGIVFVKVGEDTTVTPAKARFEARFVRLGAQNYDFAEVTDGLQQGETVALMAAAKIEQQRRAASDRMKANTSLIPGMGGQGRGGAPGGGGPPGGGGGRGRGG
jgi:HlyD family secretion protein